jgi:zinc transporter ZupT
MMKKLDKLEDFFAGMFLIALIDKLVPEAENPHKSEMLMNCCLQLRSAWSTI